MSVEARRTQLIEVGKAVFSRRAYDEVSTDELSEIAGISKGLLYHYFGNKRGFYVATMKAVAEEFSAAIAPAPGLPFAQAMLGSMEAFLDYIQARPALYRAMVRGGIGADAEVEAVVEGVRRGEVALLLDYAGVGDPSPVLWLKLYAWVGAAEAAGLAWLDRGEVPREAMIELLSGSLLHAFSGEAGVQAAPGAGGGGW
jgi:AcrR family transcriptional regulator